MLAPRGIDVADHHHHHHHHHHHLNFEAHDYHVPPISRTIQYKKVTKPLLERKRRARINKCLDELKDLMVGALEAEGENVSKLEKADILELTVQHLHRLRRPRDAAEDAHRFQAGFSQCASEACQFLLSLPGLDARVGRRLVAHLGQCVSAGPLGVTTDPQSPKLRFSTHSPSTAPNQTRSPPGPLSVQVPTSSRLCFSPPVSPSSASPELSPMASFRSPQPILSSTPSVQDLARPITGLLMTVPGKGVDSARKSTEDLRQIQQQQQQQQQHHQQPMWRPW
ncbi:enhancer of split mgamma protein-like [Zootermopsis nevadensis]|uniref:Enhancer of split mgamma protein n=1 Tax=Zootermopsis nevadensis TaxID=136037 RepID=A0A067RTB6_ZOONE|nr:enhancer of split mgamma protein-like [Zootermopsis nevadensis]KDR23064.1 Enhancer of split mgamma protein [Zootermopsis nevadensis]